MSYAIVIIDGAADLPVIELDGQTPLAAARIPNMDSAAREGRCGMVRTVPEGFSPGSDVAIMSLLGYDPSRYYTGRAPLEAAAMGLHTEEDEWIFRCNIVTIQDNIMIDYSAGNIPTEKARILIDSLNRRIKDPPARFHAGVGYRNLMTIKGDMGVVTTPPHDILDQPIPPYLPRGQGAESLISLIRQSETVFGELTNGAERQPTSIWLWGQGKPTVMDPFKERYGLEGAVITAVDLVRGIGRLIGWRILNVPGATGYFDTDYAAKGKAAIQALSTFELVCVHIEAPDEAGHEGNFRAKVKSLERIDEAIVGPLIEAMKSGSGNWRLCILPDHATPCSVRTHTVAPVPFCLAGTNVVRDRTESFDENSILLLGSPAIHGHRLMSMILS